MTHRYVVTGIALLSIVAIAAGSAVGVTLGVSATDATASPGGTAAITYTVANADEDTSTATALNLSGIPSGWTIDEVDKNGGEYSEGTSTVLWVNEPGDRGQVSTTITLGIPADATGGDYSIEGAVSGVDGRVTDRATATVTIDARAEFELDAASVAIEPNETATVPITISNDGAGAATGVVMRVGELPPEWSLTDLAGDGTPKVDTGEVVYLELAPGDVAQTNATVAVPANASPGEYPVEVALETGAGPIASQAITVTIEEGAPTLIERYDADGDGTIATAELLAAIEDWSDGAIETSEVFRLVEEWQAGNDA